MRRIALTCILNVSLILCVQAQNEVDLGPKVIPPPPTASELGKYGLNSIGLGTGTVSYQIPLYEFKTRNISLPISLSYSSNGVRVDDIAPWVGMNWSLNSGGVITRIIRGKQDGDRIDLPYPDNFTSNNPLAVKYLETAALGGQDTEPDLYTFNFLNYTGKFVINEDRVPVFMPRSDLFIEQYSDNQFVIVGSDGVRYTFGATESTDHTTSTDSPTTSAVSSWFLTRIEHPLGDVVYLSYAKTNYSYYSGFSETYTAEVRPAGGVETFCDEPCSSGNVSRSETITTTNVSGVRLARIESAGYGSILFESSNDRTDSYDYRLNSFSVKDKSGKLIKNVLFDYEFSNNTRFVNQSVPQEMLKHRMFLKSVTERDRALISVKTHQFEYEDIDGLPARLSFAQDHWGFFNGANNTNLVPEYLDARKFDGEPVFDGIGGDREPSSVFAEKGILRKITYPTGAITTLSYESHSIYGQKKIAPPLTRVALTCNGQEGQLPVIKASTIISPINQIVKVNVSSALLPGYTSTYAGATLITYRDGALISSTDLNSGDQISFYVQLFANKSFTLELVAKLPEDGGTNNTTSAVYMDYIATSPQIINTNVDIGGVRIKRISNYDPVSNKTEVVNYYYGSHDNLNQSSGLTGAKPEYINQFTVENICRTDLPCELQYCTYKSLNSSCVTSRFMQGDIIYYRFVTEARGQGTQAGLIEHEFSVRLDTQGFPIWGNEPIKDGPLSNNGWDNNKEIDTRYFTHKNDSLILIKSIHNDFVKDARYHEELPGLVVRKKYTPHCPQDASYDCNESNVNLLTEAWRCVASHVHLYLDYYERVTCIAEGNDNRLATLWRHPCYGMQPGDIATQPYNLYYADAYGYQNISDWVYLAKTTETTYDDKGLNPQVKETNYIYDNDKHMQVSRIETVTSEGESFVQSIKYPLDYDVLQSNFIPSLRDRHIFNVPIKEEAILDGNQIKGKLTLYNDLGQPSDIYSFESDLLKPPVPHDPAVLIPSSDYKLKYKMDFDSETHNIKKVHHANDNNIIYRWGYGNTLPVAEVKLPNRETTLTTYQATNTVSARISSFVPDTALDPGFEVFSVQSINPVVNLTSIGTGAPTDPLLTLVLKKEDGSSAAIYNPTLGQNSMGNVTLQPGKYEWHYYEGDLSLQPDFDGFDFTISTQYLAQREDDGVLYDSFEETGVEDPLAHTGRKVWSGTYAVVLPGTPGNYVLSYWTKKASDPADEWVWVGQDLVVDTSTPQSITIGSSVDVLDELRLYPKGAQMTTYTYDPLIGITSMTDLNDITTYYKYDDFGRLSAIVDDKGNIVKSFVYHYSTQVDALDSQ